MMILKAIKNFLFIVAISIGLYSCEPPKYSIEHKRDKINETNYGSKKLLTSYSDSLVIFFESGFENTPVKISYSTIELYDTITTSNVGIADVKILGSRGDIKSVYLSIADSEIFTVDIDSTFKFFSINVHQDTIKIDYLNIYPSYE